MFASRTLADDTETNAPLGVRRLTRLKHFGMGLAQKSLRPESNMLRLASQFHQLRVRGSRDEPFSTVLGSTVLDLDCFYRLA
jgi:hypothetical protein